MGRNTVSDIPDETGIDTAETELDLPELPGAWEWLTANHTSLGKVNVFFGYKVHCVGGLMGEIDNYQHDGEVKWDVHVRDVVDLGQDGTRPASEADTCKAFDSLDAAIQAVPEQIATHYPDEPDVETEVGDVELVEGDLGVTFIDGGSGMSVTVPTAGTDDAADFIREHAGYYPSEKRDDPDEHDRVDLSDDVCVAYWDDGIFGFTHDERQQTVTIPQENSGVVRGVLRDHE